MACHGCGALHDAYLRRARRVPKMDIPRSPPECEPSAQTRRTMAVGARPLSVRSTADGEKRRFSAA